MLYNRQKRKSTAPYCCIVLRYPFVGVLCGVSVWMTARKQGTLQLYLESKGSNTV